MAARSPACMISRRTFPSSIPARRTRGSALAQKLGARVVHNPWVGFGPKKRFAKDEARHDWILDLDADEWLTDELRGEIQTAFAAPPPPATRAFRIRTRLVYPDAEL